DPGRSAVHPGSEGLDPSLIATIEDGVYSNRTRGRGKSVLRKVFPQRKSVLRARRRPTGCMSGRLVVSSSRTNSMHRRPCMAARRRFTFAFPPELASHLEAVIPPRQRNQFVAEAVKAR